MKGAACVFALALLTSCGDRSPSSAEAAASAEDSDLLKKFTALMENAQEEIRALKDDLGKNRGRDGILTRLAAVRRNLASARAIAHPKYAKKGADLDAAFGLFLGRKLKELEESTWEEKTGTALWKKLQAGCAACHQQFRD